MQYTLRQARESDIEYLLSLRKQTMGPHMRAMGLATNEEVQVERVKYAFEHASVVEIDGKAAGLFKVQAKPEEQSYYIVQIQVDPNFQGQGLGRELISDLFLKAQEKGWDVTLSVLKKNPALKLYQRLGFACEGETSDEYLMRYTSNMAVTDEN